MPEELAAVVDARRSHRRERYLNKTDGKLLGRPASHAVRHLLSGLLRCPCGATFEAQNTRYGFSEVLDVAMQRLARQSDVRTELISERQRLERELANLAAAVATGGDVPTLLVELRFARSP